MSEPQSVITIRSEDDAYGLLQKLVDKSINIGDRQLSFEGWPTLTLRLQGQDYQSTITPPVMKAFLELQLGIYRSYATAKYNSPHKRLTNEEKSALEIRVKVEPGSSIFSIDMQQLLERLCHELVGKMDPTTIVISVLGAGVIWGGVSSYKSYLDHRTQVRQTEIKSEENRVLIEQLKFGQEQETQRAKVLADALGQNARLQTIANISEDTKASLIKRSSGADIIEIQGVELTGQVAEELVKNARRKSEELRLDGLYRILNVDSSNPEEFKVKIRCQSSGDEFVAKVQDRTLERLHLEALKNGEWSRKAVKLQINAKLLDDAIKDAVVIKAEFPEE